MPNCGSQLCLAEQRPICHSRVRARHYRSRFRAGTGRRCAQPRSPPPVRSLSVTAALPCPSRTGDWDEYFTKEARKAKGGGRSYALVGGALVLLLVRCWAPLPSSPGKNSKINNAMLSLIRPSDLLDTRPSSSPPYLCRRSRCCSPRLSWPRRTNPYCSLRLGCWAWDRPRSPPPCPATSPTFRRRTREARLLVPRCHRAESQTHPLRTTSLPSVLKPGAAAWVLVSLTNYGT